MSVYREANTINRETVEITDNDNNLRKEKWWWKIFWFSIVCSKEEEMYMLIMACYQINRKAKNLDTLISDISSVFSIFSLLYRCSSALFQTGLGNFRPYLIVHCATDWKTQSNLVWHHMTVIRNCASSLLSTTTKKCDFTSKPSLCLTSQCASSSFPAFLSRFTWIWFGSFSYTSDLCDLTSMGKMWENPTDRTVNHNSKKSHLWSAYWSIDNTWRY